MIHRFVDLPAVPTCTGLPYAVQLFTDGFFVYKCAEQIVSGLEPEFEAGSNPILSPDGTMVAFDINFPGPNGEGQIRVQPVGGGAYTVVSPDDAGGPWMINPCWGPNSDRLVYIHADPTEGFNGSIVEVPLSAPGAETVLYTPSDVTIYGPRRPTYNRDGTKIAFILHAENASAVNADTGLYVMDSDGSNVTQLDSWATSQGNSFASDGSQICWGPGDVIYYGRYSFTGGPIPQTVYKINADGTGMTELSDAGDTAGLNCRITNRALPASDDFLIVTAEQPDLTWRICRLEIDGSGGTILNNINVPDGREYFRTAYVHPQDQRIWFIERAIDNGWISSMALDGSDYRLEHDIGTIPGQAFTPTFQNGSGIEWN